MKIQSVAVLAAVLHCINAESIYEIAAGTDDFSTLAAAVDAAGLDEALSGDGTFTVFAPPNSAFEKLPEGAVEKLLEPEWKFHLTDVLLYHALGSEARSTDLTDDASVETLNGEDILINLDPPRINEESEILIDDGLVDVEADNGVIHGISDVLLPTSVTKNIVEIGAANDDFSTLVAAAEAAGLVDALSGDGPLTLFAPTNEAFADLPEGTVESLLKPKNKQQLVEILTYHVVAANAHSSTLEDGEAETLNGAPITISVDDGVMVNDANVVAADVLANNGIIHAIDKVLLPPTDEVDEKEAMVEEKTEKEAEKVKDKDEDEKDDDEEEKKETKPAKSKCDGKATVLDIVLKQSGSKGFDDDAHDFDILRELVLFLGLEGALGDPADGGLSDITVFAPRDHAFYLLAISFSKYLDDGKFSKGASYKEEKVFNYLVDTLTTVAKDLDTDLETLATNVILYHVADEDINFMKLAKAGHTHVEFNTLFEDADKLGVTMAPANDISDMRMKLLHPAKSPFNKPKIHNRLFDIVTCNGRLNVIKRVLIPLEI